MLLLGLTSVTSTAQTFNVLHDFSGSDGNGPHGLVLSGTRLYGTAEVGGITNDYYPYGCGAVFMISIDGNGYPCSKNSTGTMGLFLLRVWSCQAQRFMGQRCKAEVPGPARCSRSKAMGAALM